MLGVEAPLIERQMTAIDTELNKAIADINWTTEGLGQIVM